MYPLSVLFEVVKAGVQVKWERYARSRFYLLCGWYALFVILFTAWSVTEGAVDPEVTTGPSHGSTWSAAEGVGGPLRRSHGVFRCFTCDFWFPSA